MLEYEITPGPAASAADPWPASSRLVRHPYHPTLIMFLHPHCPCSRASLAELSILASRCKGRAAMQVVFVKPPDVEQGWECTGLYETAQRLPGANVFCDQDGVEAIRFAVSTSGETLLFSPGGRLLFQGGITPSRGHEGESAGRTALTEWLDAGRSQTSRSAVFGCPLSNQRFPSQEPASR